MKLVVQEFLTLDGVSQGPGSPDEDTSDGFKRGGWFVPHLDEEFDRLVGTWLGEADAFLFGRRTYQNFARDWPKMTDHPFAGILNGLPKYVASQPDQGRVEPDRDPVRRHPRPGRRTEAAARPGTADPRQRPAGPVPTGRRADRHVAARDRPGRGGPGPTPVPGRRRTGRPAARQPSDDTRRPVGTHLRNDGASGVRDLRGRRVGTWCRTGTDGSHRPVELPHLDWRSLMIPYTFRWSRGFHEQ